MARVFTPLAIGSHLVRKQRTYTKEDFFRTKLLFRILFLVAFMAILSLFTIWSRVQIVQYGYGINDLRKINLELLEQSKKLKVEVATLRSPGRLEKMAIDKLKMQPPHQEQIRQLP